MFVKSKAPVYSNVFLLKVLGAFLVNPAAALLAAPKLKLFSAVVGVPNPSSIIADFTEVVFTGYAEFVVAAWGGVINLPAGNGKGNLVSKDWACTAAPAPATQAAGYYIIDGVDLVMAELFDAPVPIAAIGDFVSLDVTCPGVNSEQIDS